MDRFLELREKIVEMKDRSSIEEVEKYLPLYNGVK
jgi:hypothetical protein